jgi:hypothetical protein
MSILFSWYSTTHLDGRTNSQAFSTQCSNHWFPLELDRLDSDVYVELMNVLMTWRGAGEVLGWVLPHKDAKDDVWRRRSAVPGVQLAARVPGDGAA